MSDGPKLSVRAEAEHAARREREATALRANLRRRKEQQRATPGGVAAGEAELEQDEPPR